MERLTGTYFHTLDDRGRVALPAKLREKLGEKVAVTNGIAHHSLVVYPEDKWDVISDHILAAPAVNEEENDIRLFFFGDATEADVDGQGRIAIPEYLREYAGMTGEVAIVGAGDHIQIWDKEAWIAKRAALRAKAPSLPSIRTAESASRHSVS